MFPARERTMSLAVADHANDTADRLLSTSSCSSLTRAWKNHRHILASVFISLIVCAWFVTWGDWNFFAGESFCKFYDAQALSLTQGRLDVPPEAIGFEAYEFAGKTYGYFGIGPALLRLPLVLTLGDLAGLWSRLMMMIACVGNIVCAYGIFLAIRRSTAPPSRSQSLLHSIFVICAGLGSTNVFLMSRSFVFHEATMWGSVFALAWAWALISYFQTGRLRLLIFACVFAFLSFHSRPTAGAGALLGLGVVAAILICKREITNRFCAGAISGTGRSRQLAILGAAMLMTIGVYVAVNYAKFQTFNGIPVQYYQLYMQNPERMRATGGRQLHVGNIPTTTANYFGLDGIRLAGEFPWLFLNDRARVIGSPSLDVVEPFSTIPFSMSALSVLGVIGAIAAGRGASPGACQARLPALALLAGGSIVLMTVGITERYLHDFYPAIIVLAATGLSTLERSRRWRAATAILAVLTIASVTMNCSFALVFQRGARWGVPAEKRAEFVEWQRSIGAFFGQSQ
jgi:hypothetical protein